MNKNCSNDHEVLQDLPEALLRALGQAFADLPAPAASAERILPHPGAYVLAIDLGQPAAISLPRQPEILLPAGWYLYCGSARGPGGLAARLGRHLAAEKKQRWHVDRLTVSARRRIALPFPGDMTECRLVAAIAAMPQFSQPAPGFGSSDCRICKSHLLKWQGAPE
ncbi:MAG: GIY-YIG nuclease family protein [Hyphomicrobiales bacterium]